MKIDLSLQADEVDVHDLTIERFLQQYHRPQKPVVIRGLMATLPAGKKWSIEWFKETMGDEEIELYDNRIQSQLKTAITTPDLTMPLAEYLNIIARDEPTPLRMFLADLFKIRPELRNDFPCPPFVDGLLGKVGFMFMGGKNTDVRFHFDIDHSCVLLTQVFGRKRVVLFGPEYSALLYKLPFNTFANVDLANPDFEKHPGLRYVKGYEIYLEPGDAVYMPSGYWHYNTYLTGGMGVSYRKLSPRPADWLKGLLHVGVYMPFDKTMNRLLGDRWYDYKQRRMVRNAEAAIRRQQNQQGAAVPA